MGKLSKLKGMLINHKEALRYVCSSNFTKSVNYRSPVLLDTSIDSRNAGDSIIMHYVNLQLEKVWPDYQFPRVSMHTLRNQDSKLSPDSAKILCGTNALSMSVNRYMPLALPSDPSIYSKSVVLLAVGLSALDHTAKFTKTTASFLRTLLADDIIHSVRDSHAEAALREIGIENVVNTTCVTMWNLTEEFCKSIPTQKNRDVLTTITDYCFSPDDDRFMLQTLKKHYTNVYLWIQGQEDLKKFRSLHLDGISLIQGGYSGLVGFCKNHSDYDYFGTRLHCGIYCLNHGIRSMIVSVDNRADDIESDTNLPVVKRTNLRANMERLIENERRTEIHIPQTNIDLWKSQFAK